jgi:Restriction alleviation protein Lar
MTDKTDKDLTRCPHCGSPAHFQAVPLDDAGPFAGGYFIECENSTCGASTALIKKPIREAVFEELERRWNRRSTDPATRGPAPRFPTMLRKQWSGPEVQDWINENWVKS